MGFETALRTSEILLGWVILQSSLEHLSLLQRPFFLFVIRVLCACILISGHATDFALITLFVTSLIMLHRFQGPYNGGADKMGLLILTCLTLAQISPHPFFAELALAYLAVQLILSYFVSGQIKILNPDWRSGQALADVFAFSAYPVSENLRALAKHPNIMFSASWAVMIFELIFPLSFLNSAALILALFIAALFHLTNACVFGLNRFFWTWLAAYPSILWLQHRLIGI